MTDINRTFAVLNDSFLVNGNGGAGHINTDFLNMNIQLWIDNTRVLKERIRAAGASEKRIRSVVWEGFTDLVNDMLYRENEKRFYCASYQLKKWLNQYGAGYAEIAETINYYLEENAEEAA